VRAAVFIVPIFLGFGILEALLGRTGDSLTAESAVRRQMESSEEMLCFRNDYWIYKREAISQRSPRILAIGSSRIMQLRDISFPPIEHLFYNAGGILFGVDDLEALVSMMLDGSLPTPEVLIMTIDPWWIKTTQPSDIRVTERDAILSPARKLRAYRTLLESLLRSLLRGEFTLSSLAPLRSPFYNHLAIGSEAREIGHGFRRDGSLQYNPLTTVLDFVENPEYRDRDPSPIIERVISFTNPFTLPAEVDTARVDMLISALVSLEQTGVEVHVILPPFSTEVAQALTESEPLEGWWRFCNTELVGILEEAGIDVTLVLNPTSVGLSDLYMIDGLHSSEVLMAQIIAELLMGVPSSSLLSTVDVESLTARIRNAAIPLAFQLPDGRSSAR